MRADRAPESWDAAIVALRLTDAATPVVDATDLGAMLPLARAYDPRDPHDDVRALAVLDQRAAEVLRTSWRPTASAPPPPTWACTTPRPRPATTP